ncbi:MAG TPA: hypothetical protein VGS21_03835, partial [Acidimicrobiales bacterium]|nr:hypothetical protein [Acidimicrobiales bacterium]
FMTLDGGPVNGWVTCELRAADGRLVVVGRFAVDHGWGSWATPMPAGDGSFSAAIVTGANGKVIAQAALT